MIHKRIRNVNEIEKLQNGTPLYYCESPELIPRAEYCISEFPQLESNAEPDSASNSYRLYTLQVCVPNAYIFDDEALEEYKKFLKTHANFLRPLITRYKVNLSEPRWAIVYFVSGKSRNYFYWAVKNLMADVHFNLIERALNIVFKFQTYSRNLSRGSLVAYSGIKGIHDFFNEIETIMFEREVSNAISKFAANQRKLLKSAQLSDDDKRTLLLINRIPQDVAKNFIKKMTPCMSIRKIVDELRFLVSNSIVWDKEWVKKFIKKNSLNVDIVFEDAEILLLKVKDFKSIKRLGGSTSWCITRKHAIWANYYLDTPDIAEQYVLFNFALPEYDDISILGFTETLGKGITAMHNFKNISLICRNRELEYRHKNYVNNGIKGKLVFEITSDRQKEINELVEGKHITPEEFLESIGIDGKSYKKEPSFGWNRDSVLQIINSIDDGNHIILQDKGNVLTIMASDFSATSVIRSQIDSFDRLRSSGQRIFRLDFNKERDDPESIVYVGLNDRSLPVLNNLGEIATISLKSLLDECGGDPFVLCKSGTAFEKYLLCIVKNDFDKAKEIMASREFAKEYACAPEYVSEEVFQVWDSTFFVFTNETLLITTIPFEHLLCAGISPSKFISEANAYRFLKQLKWAFEIGMSVCGNYKDMLEFEISELEKILGATKSGGTLRERVYKAIDFVEGKFEKLNSDCLKPAIWPIR